MFKRVLLPLDLSSRHDQAVNLAVELLQSGEGEIVLLHVIETIAGVSFDEERTFYNRLEKSARTHLQKIGNELERRKVRFRAEIRYGNRGPEVVRFASDLGADLIVLTAPRVDPANPAAGWGSLSYKIGWFSQCPVLLVK
jgi:nucleotide-binding universal stress UspA family protein